MAGTPTADIGTKATDIWQAVGTVAAVLLSVIALTLEGLRRHREGQEAARRQARRVVAWPSIARTGLNGGDGTELLMSYDVHATVANLGEEPIWDLRLSVIDDKGKSYGDASVFERDLLLPGAEWKPSWRDLPCDPRIGTPRPEALRLIFTDIDGERWQRQRRSIHKLGKPPADAS